jgi:hypothetical protein
VDPDFSGKGRGRGCDRWAKTDLNNFEIIQNPIKLDSVKKGTFSSSKNMK